MTHLYELTQQQRELKELAGDESIPQEALSDTFDALGAEFNEKAANIIFVSNDIESDIAAIESEIKRLTDRKKVMVNKKNSIREYLRTNMEACGINKIECPLFTITLAKGRDMAIIDDEASLPDDLVDVSVVQKPNKAEILRKLKAGDDIPGAHIEKSKTSIRIT